MAVTLTERSEIARELFDKAAEVLGYDLLGLCKAGPADQLNKTEFCQPALFVHSYASLKQLEADKIQSCSADLEVQLCINPTGRTQVLPLLYQKAREQFCFAPSM